MTEQILWYVIGGLLVFIIGGVSGQTLLRKTMKIWNDDPPDPPSNEKSGNDTAAKAAADAAKAAADIATVFHTEINSQMKTFGHQLETTNEHLSALEGDIKTLLGACPERHAAINQRLDSLDKETSELRQQH